MPANPFSRAFTLVELLVVIAIIAILAGIVIPAVGSMIGSGQMAKTRSVMSQMQGVITTYQTNTGRYPLQEPGFADSNGTEITDLEDFFQPDNALEVNIALTRILASIDQDAFGPSGKLSRETDIEADPTPRMVADAWDQPIYYQPWTSYLDVDEAINPSSYQLWSFGSDLQNDVEGGVAIPYEDDIENNPMPYGDDITIWHGS